MSIDFDTCVQEEDGVFIHEQSSFDINMSNSNACMWLVRMGLDAEQYAGHMSPEEFAKRLTTWFSKAGSCTGDDLIRLGHLLALAGHATRTGRLVGWC